MPPPVAKGFASRPICDQAASDVACKLALNVVVVPPTDVTLGSLAGYSTERRLEALYSLLAATEFGFDRHSARKPGQSVA
jgi:hypothetical protein